MKKFGFATKVILIQASFSFVLILLSLIGLFFNNWFCLVSVASGGVFSVLFTLLLIKGMNYMHPESDGKGIALFYVFSIVRLLVALVGLLIPALIINFNNPAQDSLYFLNVIGAAIPFAFINLTLIIVKDKEKVNTHE